jgi:Domain of unknown function (DUF6908)
MGRLPGIMSRPGPRGLPMVSVAHYYEQNGDLMRDPELTCEISPDGTFYPVNFTQDNVGAYHEAVFVDATGRVMVRPCLVKGLTSPRPVRRRLSPSSATRPGRRSPLKSHSPDQSLGLGLKCRTRQRPAGRRGKRRTGR